MRTESGTSFIMIKCRFDQIMIMHIMITRMFPLPKVHVWPSLVSRLAVRATQGISIFLACQAKDLKKIESIRVL